MWYSNTMQHHYAYAALLVATEQRVTKTDHDVQSFDFAEGVKTYLRVSTSNTCP